MKSIKLKKIIAGAIAASMIPVMLQSGVNAEWKQSTDNGSWSYVDDSGLATNWKLIDGKWYNFDESGVMKTGWINDNGIWYFADASGAMQTGWVNDKGIWYFTDASGAMQTGWINDRGTWYFTDTTGGMKTGWVNDKGTWYFTDTSGAMQTGVIEVAGKVYSLASSGAMQTGKVIIDNKEYNFSSEGDAVGEIPKVVKAFDNKGAGVTKQADKPATTEVSPSSTTSKNSSSNHSSSSSNSGTNSGNNGNGNPEQNKWKLIWQDDFNGNELNQNDWSYEKHDPGWVNNELQEYTDSKENIFVKDGNLVLKAIKTQKDGKDYYTSGKINTKDKKTFKYGKFEIRAKAPKGQGLWPALWMMPNNESLYGQWPKCGEIDMMEVLGNEPNKLYGTIHYGDPHEQKQGTYVLDKGTFADDYHIYGIEWVPGEIRWYIDGKLYYTANDWFTKVEGGDEVTFPAPFDQPFYMQFNLAVGGSWPGNPDETTDFDNAEFKVDYIKAYQLDSYDENVKKPEAEVILRDPDINGNYIINGDFSKDDGSWKFLTALNGIGNYNIANNKMTISTKNAGTADYSIQLVQPGVPLKEGGKYRVTFDAKANEDRTMIADVSGPDRSYVRYFNDTKVDLTTDVKTYSYEFTMDKEDDANGRLEFNLGNQGSLADVELSNVKIEKIGQIEKDENESKKIMPDGNYVNNGTFDVGEDRMKYWEVKSKSTNTQINVTNSNNSRELKVDTKDNNSLLEDVSVKQTNLALTKNDNYALYFDAYADKDKTIKACINGEEFSADLTNNKKTFKFEFSTGEELSSKDLELLLGGQGITYIDNVRIEENSLIRNGAFDSGLTGWNVYVDGSSQASGSVDSLKEKNAAQLEIADTGDQDWKIQLKQNNVKLEEGQKYRLSFDAKSTTDRDIMYAIQRDGSKDNNWDPYSGSKVIEVGNDFKTYTNEFEMKKPTDENAIFTISMGAVNGKQIKDKHTVTVDNVKLEKIDELTTSPENKPEAGTVNNDNLITNGDFSSEFSNWGYFATTPAAATFSITNDTDKAAAIDVTGLGTNAWDAMLYSDDINLSNGVKYILEFDAWADEDRDIVAEIQQNSGAYNTYAAKTVALDGTKKHVTLEFTMPNDDAPQVKFCFGNTSNPTLTKVYIDNVSLKAE
ncbi:MULTISPECIES: carbohydrate binding domain-containing protein [unclassified Clostridium]|uniref:carbohydrate binding domain-containing protein n=1 Tax=unclassified Clostridium TaxID=2614128 RepID=UPI0002978DCF|nr:MULTISPECIES: carbohydrate binding domain-containing protein [unclassified Clostridium]EKQ50387.1 MAG: beta-glucanase/beta-glucan synthetase [Clostridium sp. Maddingley MBC34-26]